MIDLQNEDVILFQVRIQDDGSTMDVPIFNGIILAFKACNSQAIVEDDEHLDSPFFYN